MNSFVLPHHCAAPTLTGVYVDCAHAFLGGVPVRLMEGKYFVFVAAFGGNVPETGPIEGVGVTPDVVVPPCREFCAGRDPQLDRAIEMIRSELGRVAG